MIQLTKTKYPSVLRLPWAGDTRTDEELNGNSRDNTHRSYTIDYRDTHVTVLEKIDGGNIGFTNKWIHARSIEDESISHPAYKHVLSRWQNMRYVVPDNIYVWGEDVHVTRSIKYDRLPRTQFPFFFVFTVAKIALNGELFVLSIDETIEFCNNTGLTMVPIIYSGKLCDMSHNDVVNKPRFGDVQEGYVVRPTSSYRFNDTTSVVAKYVRPNHVQTSKHWKFDTALSYNTLVEK